MEQHGSCVPFVPIVAVPLVPSPKTSPPATAPVLSTCHHQDYRDRLLLHCEAANLLVNELREETGQQECGDEDEERPCVREAELDDE